MPREPISACVIARDEADRIGACLASLAFCDETLVVDAHSSDATRELCRELGARVIERDWPGFAAQKEFALRAARHDWVLCVDADERASPELRREIEALREQAPVYRMPDTGAYVVSRYRDIQHVIERHISEHLDPEELLGFLRHRIRPH